SSSAYTAATAPACRRTCFRWTWRDGTGLFAGPGPRPIAAGRGVRAGSISVEELEQALRVGVRDLGEARRRDPGVASEHLREVRRVVEADEVGHLGDLRVRVLQQTARFPEPEADQVLLERQAVRLLEQPAELERREVAEGRRRRARHLAAIVLLDVPQRPCERERLAARVRRDPVLDRYRRRGHRDLASGCAP